MSRKSKRDRLPCVYCGKPGTTRDHIPPKGLFGKNKPSNLITVPSCEKCNNGANLDDQYFLRLALAYGSEQTQAGREANEAFLRSIKRPEAKGMRAQFFQAVSPVTVLSPGGLYLGQGLRFRLEKDRLDRVFNRLIRGLFWKHQQRRLPDGYETDWHAICSTAQIPQEQAENQVLITAVQPMNVGDGTAFRYRYAVYPEDSNLTIFRFEFFQTLGFMGDTGKELENDQFMHLVLKPPAEPPAPAA